MSTLPKEFYIFHSNVNNGKTYIKSNILEEKFFKFYNIIRSIATVFKENGYDCYVVGGSVRDIILGKEIGDIDIATNATPDRVQQLFDHTIPTGIKHGTITVVYKDAYNKSETFEVTTYRTEGKYTDGRRPDIIEYAKTIEDDLSRRDFTMNAIALDPLTGFIVDPFGGKEDIENKIIRTVGNPIERLTEDGLRAVRAARFTATLGFKIAPETLVAMKDPAVQEKAKGVAIERFKDELYKALRSKDFHKMIMVLFKSGLNKHFLPGIGLGNIRELKKRDSIYFSLRFALLCYGYVEINRIRDLTSSLKMSRENSDLIKISLMYIDLQKRGAELIEIKRFLSYVKALSKHYTFIVGFIFKQYIVNIDYDIIHKHKNEPLTIKDLKITGDDLKEIGIKGKQIGRDLRMLLENVLYEPELNTKEKLLLRIKELYEKYEQEGWPATWPGSHYYYSVNDK